MALRTFDDRDPAVQYVGVWQTSGNPGAEYNGTTTWTDVSGSTARVTFTGTGISAFGTVAIGTQPTSEYSVEGDSSRDARFVATNSSSIQYGVKFYEANDLDLGRHVLIITNEQSNTQFFLDYFTVAGESVPPIASATGNPPTSSIPSPTASSSTTPAATSSSPPIGPIVGGVLGGVALICLTALAIVFYRGRKRRESHPEHGVDPSQVSGPPSITPFVVEGSQHRPAPSQGLSYTSHAGVGSIASSSQAPTFATFQRNEKHPPSIPMSSSSNLTSLPSSTGKNLDPPPRYEG